MNLEIKDMKAGPELDALVNEHVMKRCRHKWKVCGPNVWNHQCEKCGVVDHNFSQCELYVCGKDEEVSTEISAAWEVIETMKKRNWWIVLNSEGDKWSALFYWDPHQQACEAESPTAPEAICKASLLAVII